MSKLIIREITKDSETLKDFCGVPSIDALINKSYYATLLKYGHAYEVVLNSKVIGYYMITSRIINSNSIKNNEDYDCGFLEQKFGAIKLEYIAIKKDMQHKTYGTLILGAIIRIIQEISKQLPIRYIILDALNEKIPWYKRFNFCEFNYSTNDKLTTPMYYDCLTEEQLLTISKYIEENTDIYAIES